MKNKIDVQHETKEYIVFQLNNEFFGVPLQSLNQISSIVSSRSFPNTLPYIRGVIEIDEKIIPVIDLKRKLGLKIEDDNSHFLLIYENEGNFLAFPVDNIFEILETKIVPKKEFTYVPKEIHTFSDGTFRFKRKEFGHTNEDTEELIILLNMRKIYDMIKRESITWKLKD